MDTKFKKKDFNKYDKKTKKRAVAFLEQLFEDAKVYENPDKYGIDIIVKKGSKKLYFEVEYKEFRDLQRLSEEGMHISARKKKFYKDNKRSSHITFLDDYRRAIVVKNGVLRKAKTIVKGCWRGNEYYPSAQFIEIKLKDCLLYKKKGKWKKCKEKK